MSDHPAAEPPATGPRHLPRYVGIPTFFRTPYRPELDGTDIGIVGVPYDGGVTNRPGARHGPREVRNASTQVRRINQATRVAPFERLAVADLGDAPIEHPFELEGSHAEIRTFFDRVRAAGIVPLTVGGDHSISLPILRALAADRPVGMVHIDAHCDTGDDYFGSRFHHGAPFSRAVEEGLLDPRRTIQIGIRGSVNDLDLWRFSHESGMRVVYIEELWRRGVDAVAAEARHIVGDGPVYLSFDIDSLDPAFAPGTGTPEIGGLTSLEAILLLRQLRGLDFVGGDLVEIAPPLDPSGMTAYTGAVILFEMLCLVAERMSAD
jgi:guanidinopropionase